VALGPDAVVYHKKRQRDKSGLPRDEWTPLGGRFEGSLAGVAVDETRLSLFALDADGAAFHKSYIDGEPPDAAWQPLGGAFVGSLGVTPGPRNHIELFGVDREGTAYHRSIDPTGCNTRDDWERIGANVTGELSPLYSQRAGVTVFTLGRDGSVAYKRLDGEEWQPGAGKWESLGGQFEGVLTARLLADGGVLLVVICSDRSVHTLNWSNYPEDRANQGWEAVGTIDSIFESLGREWKRASPPALEGSESTVEDKVEAEPLRARSHVAGKR
jgi:hypothetical protein